MRTVQTHSARFIQVAMSFCVCLLTSASLHAQSKPVDQTIVDELVAANKILAAEGILDGWGHVSVRNPSDPTHYFLARNLAAELVTAKDIMEFTLDNVPVASKGQD